MPAPELLLVVDPQWIELSTSVVTAMLHDHGIAWMHDSVAAERKYEFTESLETYGVTPENSQLLVTDIRFFETSPGIYRLWYLIGPDTAP
jgi:hypothetical protein